MLFYYFDNNFSSPAATTLAADVYSFPEKKAMITQFMEFNELNLHPDLQKGLNEAEYITCMPVQEQVLQQAFSGQDLYVQSQTGTGKTAAYLVVIFQRLLTEDMLHGKKAIIMVPTRELAVQVEEEAKVIGKYLPFKIASFYGGVGYTQQTAMLRNNAQIMVGTPGRVLDLNQSGLMNLMDIAFLILDEADRMFDMGFYPDLRKLIRAVPPANKRQTMLFSATLNAWVKNLAWEYTSNPYEIAIESETVTVDEVEQLLYHVSSQDKMKLLLGILRAENPKSAIVFCNTKRYAEIVARRLRLNGFECEFIMGDLPQPKRLKIIENIKSGKLSILVATDVAARGLDIENLSLVINYDLPNESENYVHRIGRTARAGKTGKAITIASEQDVYELPAIERYLGTRIPSLNATGDLLSEDKSEGRHIQTDMYENRGRKERDGRTGQGRQGKRNERSQRGGNSRREFDSQQIDSSSQDGRSDRSDRQSDRQSDRHGSRFGGRTQGSRAQGGRDNRKKGIERRRSGSGKETRLHVNLSEMSLEERMAYYKEKYDNSGRTENTENKIIAGNPVQNSSSKKRQRRKSRSKNKTQPILNGRDGSVPGRISGEKTITSDPVPSEKARQGEDRPVDKKDRKKGKGFFARLAESLRKK